MAELPAWQPVGSFEGGVSAGSGGRVVAIVATEQATSAGWSGAVALDVAQAFATGGSRVMLADAALEAPSLHDAAQRANGEGLTDAVLYGASVPRVAHPVDGRGFFLITAGTVTADTSSVARHDRWHQITSGFIEAGATLLVFVKDGQAAASAFLGACSQVIVVAGDGDPPPAAVQDLEALVSAVVGPGAGAAAPVASSPAGELSADALKATAKAGRGRVMILSLLVVLLIVALLGVFGIVAIPGLQELLPSPEGEGSIDLATRYALGIE